MEVRITIKKGNAIEDDGCYYLSRQLEALTKLSNLELAGIEVVIVECSITSKGLICITNFIKLLKKLEVFYIWGKVAAILKEII